MSIFAYGLGTNPREWLRRRQSGERERCWLLGTAKTNKYEKEDFVDTKTRGERVVEEGQGYRRRYRIVEVTMP